METKITNNQKIIDAFCERQTLFSILKEKSEKCLELSRNISTRIGEAHDIFKVLLNNFSSERKPLGIFVLRSGYGYNDKVNKPLWITSKSSLSRNDLYYYEELCLHSTGFSLLSSYGKNSQTIMMPNDTSTSYYLNALKDEIPQKKLKEVLKQEKLDLLNKVLEGVENLIYSSEYEMPLILDFKKLDIGYGKFEVRQCNINYISLNADRSWFRMMLKHKMVDTNEDFQIGISNIRLDDMPIIEQIAVELLGALDIYENILQNKFNEVEKYYGEMKGRFTKELICINLKPQKQEN